MLGLIAANEMIVAKWCPFNLTWTAATISEHGMWRSAVHEPGRTPPGSYLHGTMTFTGSTATYGGSYNGSDGGYMSMFDTPRLPVRRRRCSTSSRRGSRRSATR